MSSSDGLAGALMLGQQLETYRWEDHWRRMSGQTDLAAQVTSLRSQLRRLGAEYDAVVDRHNQLAQAANAAVQDGDSVVAELNKRLAAVELERDRARAEAAYLRTAFDAGINLGSDR